mgnify:CR=1 FL=1
MAPTPSALPAQNPLPVYIRRVPYHRNSARDSPSKHYNTVVAPTSQSKQTFGSPPTRDTSNMYAPYSYTTRPLPPYIEPPPPFQKPSPFAPSHSNAVGAVMSPLFLSSPTFAPPPCLRSKRSSGQLTRSARQIEGLAWHPPPAPCCTARPPHPSGAAAVRPCTRGTVEVAQRIGASVPWLWELL